MAKMAPGVPCLVAAMTGISLRAKIYISLTAAAGLASLTFGLLPWHSTDPARLLCYLLIATLTSGLKVTLPGITGTMSVNFLFILISIVELSFPEALVIGSAGTLVQCLWKPRSRIQPIQLLFSIGSMAVTIAACSAVYHFLAGARLQLKLPLLLALSACVFFLLNTLQVAAAISLTERKPLLKLWAECYLWSFPYYLAGAAMAGLVRFLNEFVNWKISVLVLPIVYWIYRSYGLYVARLEAEKNQVEEMAGLHLRTIEALALAIEAKDSTAHAHLQRVRVYALEVGKELGLSELELEALRAAALLHDIGKLAVPEHIISKPGKLTPVEFERMKIHPVVGAEILERVEFPYPVAPIVRCHHEKWDGTGYPSGLKGEEIPIGARILAAVDCLDALASDRQYRLTLPLDQAMAQVASQAGQSFDPRVVEVLERRYQEIERLVQKTPVQPGRLATTLKAERDARPAAEKAVQKPALLGAGALDFLSSIADARQEAQALFELTQNLGNSLSLDETLSVLALRLKRLVPYDSIAVYVRREGILAPQYVSGENFRLFSSLEIPMGEGLSGWVAENKKPIINGNPSVEPGYLDNPDKFSTLSSALTVPLEGVGGLVGVLSLYHAEKDFFTKDHLRVLLAIADKAALSIENALKYRQAETCATTDALTGLPNARSLFLHLDRELARSKRLGTPLSVLVCDLDGFKQVNDRFGHLEGNKLLRALAEGLQEACRGYDYVARMGGDEFVVVLPGHRAEAVRAKIMTLMKMANEAGRRVCGEQLLSMSVGGAFYPDDGDDAEQLLAEADRRMYKAKQKLTQPDLSEWNPKTVTSAVQ